MIYLDNAATTKPNKTAVAFASEYLNERYFNPSASYFSAQAVRADIEGARREIIKTIADPQKWDLIFTSGGTEADNLALNVTSHYPHGGLVSDMGEHDAVYKFCENRRKHEKENTIIVNIDRSGSVIRDELLRAVNENTVIVSVMHVNNETGAINDIVELAHAVKKINPNCLFHSDGVQAYGKIPFELTDDIDLYSVSAHKIGGVKGTGALFVNKRVAFLSPLFLGGGQERGLRSGTENVFGIMAFYRAAMSAYADIEADYGEALVKHGLLLSDLSPSLFELVSPYNGSPYILTAIGRGIEGEALQLLLDNEQVIVGTGSACSSHGGNHRVIRAGGYTRKEAHGAIRLSISHWTTSDELIEAAEKINTCARQLKGVSNV